MPASLFLSVLTLVGGLAMSNGKQQATQQASIDAVVAAFEMSKELSDVENENQRLKDRMTLNATLRDIEKKIDDTNDLIAMNTKDRIYRSEFREWVNALINQFNRANIGVELRNIPIQPPENI